MSATEPSDREVDDASCQISPQCGATIHTIYNPFNPPLNAIISVARRLQEALIEHGALSPDGPFPFPELAPKGHN